LRLDVDHPDSGLAYGIPPDNPFVGVDGARGEIWAYGLRNVWRMCFDPNTGDLYAGDVGQNRWEEIDLIVKGGNFGWNIREGAHGYAGGESEVSLIDPLHEYPHSAPSGEQSGASVTGGLIYRGNRLPDLVGAYVYADFVTGTIWALRQIDGVVTEHMTLDEQPVNIASFGEGPDGTLYLCAFDGRIRVLEEN